MSSRSSESRAPAVPVAPVVVSRYRVGAHDVRVTRIVEGRWSTTVDDAAVPGTFSTLAEAWEAGVRAADRLPPGGPADAVPAPKPAVG